MSNGMEENAQFSALVRGLKTASNMVNTTRFQHFWKHVSMVNTACFLMAKLLLCEVAKAFFSSWGRLLWIWLFFARCGPALAGAR